MAKRALEHLVENPMATIYVALRLFDVEEKLKGELLDRAVKEGVTRALDGVSLGRPFTFVPFRDSDQNADVTQVNTQALYNADRTQLDNTIMLVTYYDGLGKDEGVSFEIGYCYGKGIPFILISTDFIQLEFPSKQVCPFDPLPYLAARTVVRRSEIPASSGDFMERLRQAREGILRDVADAVQQACLLPLDEALKPYSQSRHSAVLDFGGGHFEWQRMAAERLAQLDETLYVSERFSAASDSPVDLARRDITALRRSRLLIVGSDADEAPCGTAFLQGVARAMGLEVWLYNSKSTFLVGPLGYRMSRNLMLDYSADRTFESLGQLDEALRLRLKGEAGG